MSRFLIASAVTVLVALLTVALPSGAEPAEPLTASPEVDTAPPAAFIRARKRQDMDYVFKHGVQATCGTHDDEKPLTCRMFVARKGKVLAVHTCHFDRPFNRCHFDLHLARIYERRIREAGHSYEVRLRLRATGEAGNPAYLTKRVKIVEGLWG